MYVGDGMNLEFFRTEGSMPTLLQANMDLLPRVVGVHLAQMGSSLPAVLFGAPR